MYERFLELLTESGMTAYKVAKETGIATSTFSDWKSGRSAPKHDKLAKIADYFGVSVDWLIGSSQIKSPTSLGLSSTQAQNIAAKSNAKNTDEFTAKNPNERKVLLLARKTENLPPEKREKVINFFEETIDTYLEAMGDIFGKNKDGE